MKHPILHVVSVSGGKDSAATAILALETQPRDALRFVFADTGNEDQQTIDYVAYMARHLGITITALPPRDFSREIAGKREYVVKHWPRKGVSEADIERALTALQPTGNPFLDLCIWKGRFPSRKAQFCTEQLKTLPLTEWQMDLIESGQCEAVWSWQGVRIDESQARRARLECPVSPPFSKFFEVTGGGAVRLSPDPALAGQRLLRGAPDSRPGAEPAVSPRHGQGGLHALHQRRQGRGVGHQQTLPAAHRPHRLLGAVRGPGQPAHGGQLLRRPRPRCPPEQARHPQRGGLEQDQTRWSGDGLDQGDRGTRRLQQFLWPVRVSAT